MLLLTSNNGVLQIHLGFNNTNIEEGKKKKTEMRKLSDKKISLQAKKQIIVDENEKLKKENTKRINENEELLKENEKLKEVSQVSTQDVRELENEGNQTEVAKRGKHLNLLRRTMQASSLEKGEVSSSYCSEERQSRTFPGNNRETSSESNCSRKRKGASYNSEELLGENEKLKEASKELTQNVRGLGYKGNQNKVAKRGKHLSLLQAPSLNRVQVSSSKDRQSRSFQFESDSL